MASDLVILSGQQRALYEALLEKEPRLASMYFGVVAVLEQHDNPDRLALAAHGLRELMEKLPRYFNVPAETQPSKIEKLRSLERTWDRAIRKSNCYKKGNWDGPIDRFVKTLLEEVGAFFAWQKENVPTRKQSTIRALRALDGGSPISLSLPIENMHITEWESIERFCIRVSHHDHLSGDEEFRVILSRLEVFLRDQLTPRTFEDHETIDAIIREGEGK